MIIFTDSARFMASSLSDLVHNFSEVIHISMENIKVFKYKYERDDKNYETCGIKYKYCNCFHEHI